MNTKNLTVKICSSWMGMWVPNLFFFFMGIRTLKLQGVPQKVKFIIFLNDVFLVFGVATYREGNLFQYSRLTFHSSAVEIEPQKTSVTWNNR